MQKKIVALAVAGLSTAAFAQTNVTIYGVADVSGQGYALSQSKGLSKPTGAQGNTFNVQSNSSLIGFKGTEDLGNGLKALFQAETTLYLTGGSAAAVQSGSLFGTNAGSMRDTFVGMNSKYGTGLAGYVSTPFRSSLVSFDVMPGATGSSQIDNIMGGMRLGSRINNETAGAGGLAASSAVRATAIAYAMPTLYGFDGSIAYTGSNNNGQNNNTRASGQCADLSACTLTPQSAWGFNLGWTGYGVNIKGAFQQAAFNNNQPLASLTATGTQTNSVDGIQNLGAFTSYLVGAMYTGLPNLKASVVYNRNSLGIREGGVTGYGLGGANKLSNNQLYAGASYRMGNWEPRLSAVWSSSINGSDVANQTGARQWTANLGYYLSKRTQVYGLISNLNNSANQNYAMGQQTSNLKPTGGENLFTYGMGLRTTF